MTNTKETWAFKEKFNTEHSWVKSGVSTSYFYCSPAMMCTLLWWKM